MKFVLSALLVIFSTTPSFAAAGDFTSVSSGDLGSINLNEETSSAKTFSVVLKNNSTSKQSLSPVLSGPDAGSFLIVLNRCVSVSAGKSCAVSLSSKKALAGKTHQANLSDSSGSITSLSLAIIPKSLPAPVIALSASPASLDVSFQDSSKSKIEQVVIKNEGNVAIRPTTILASSTNALIVLNRCEASLKPQATCVIYLSVKNKTSQTSLKLSSEGVDRLSLPINVVANGSPVSTPPPASNLPEIDLTTTALLYSNVNYFGPDEDQTATYFSYDNGATYVEKPYLGGIIPQADVDAGFTATDSIILMSGNNMVSLGINYSPIQSRVYLSRDRGATFAALNIDLSPFTSDPANVLIAQLNSFSGNTLSFTTISFTDYQYRTFVSDDMGVTLHEIPSASPVGGIAYGSFAAKDHDNAFAYDDNNSFKLYKNGTWIDKTAEIKALFSPDTPIYANDRLTIRYEGSAITFLVTDAADSSYRHIVQSTDGGQTFVKLSTPADININRILSANQYFVAFRAFDYSQNTRFIYIKNVITGVVTKLTRDPRQIYGISPQ